MYICICICIYMYIYIYIYTYIIIHIMFLFYANGNEICMAGINGMKINVSCQSKQMFLSMLYMFGNIVVA